VAKNLDGMTLSPNHVYTFHIWQHLIDFSTYKLSVGSFINIDLAAVLNGQPLQLTVIDTKVGRCKWRGEEAEDVCVFGGVRARGGGGERTRQIVPVNSCW
jgi:hypothetical protein